MIFDAERDLDREEVVVEQVVEEVVEEDVVEKEVAEKSTPKAKGVAPKARSISISEPSESHRADIPKKNLNKGKGKMVEPEKPLKRKYQILLDKEEARRLQAIFDEEARMAKEEAEKEAQLVEDWDNMKAKIDIDF
ncbi:hypothetical protein Tco_0821201 [Tanacetum coccineum]|uniref:Uncharacterized protein n=1 Tax=Tanacetum coccineum TaxID=301880 RepID=A0ABQ5AE74_9ASTR